MSITHKMQLPIALVVVSALCAAGTPAGASNWSMNGSSCVPNDTSIGHYFVTGGSVTHRPNSTAPIILYCPISSTWGSNKPTRLAMTYMDNNPQIATITAQVIRLVASNGTLSVISRVLRNDRDPELVGRHVETDLLPHNFDFKNSYYYVRVDITRTNAGAFAKLFGVSLDCATCPAN
jgi:hypothetical protein